MFMNKKQCSLYSFHAKIKVQVLLLLILILTLSIAKNYKQDGAIENSW